MIFVILLSTLSRYEFIRLKNDLDCKKNKIELTNKTFKQCKEIGKESDINERLNIKIIIEKNKVINKKLKSKYKGVYKFKKEIIRTNNINKTCNLASAIIKF